MSKFETVIGLEVHVQLNTFSKAFCSDDASFGGQPNAHLSAISLAYPGTLPVFNKKQLESALKLGLALGCKIHERSFFDRKNYFYADLPKGFQTTQDRQPICTGGGFDLQLPTGKKRIRLHHFHMEEDAGKSLHDQHATASLVDLNRAGVPLLEIVTEPDFRSAAEVSLFLTEIRRLVRWLDISDGNMEEGSLRCDINLSIKFFEEEKLGTRCEMKNINSMRFARRAIEFESKRQIEILENGGKIEQQTRSFDPTTGTTAPLRDKEDAHDYRYFPEPDLPPVVVSEKLLEKTRLEMPVLPSVLAERFADFGLPASDVEQMISERETAFFFEKLLAEIEASGGSRTGLPKLAATLVIQKILPFLETQQLDFQRFNLSTVTLVSFLKLIESNQISSSTAYQKLFPVLLENPSAQPEKLAAELQLFQTSDDDFLEKLIGEVLEKWPEKVVEFQKGKKGLLGFFTGEVMKLSKGKADPQAVGRRLVERLAG